MEPVTSESAFLFSLAVASVLPAFLLRGYTRQHVTVALSGNGGDELFTG